MRATSSLEAFLFSVLFFICTYEAHTYFSVSSLHLVSVSVSLSLSLSYLVDVFVGGEVEAADVDVDRVVEDVPRQLLCGARTPTHTHRKRENKR